MSDALALEEMLAPPGAPPAGPARGGNRKLKAAPAPTPQGDTTNVEFNKLHPRSSGGQFTRKGDGYPAAGQQGQPHRMATQLQQRLKQLGFNVTVDGKFGVYTEMAVKAFQERYGLEPTGKVDQATTDLLRNPPEQTLQQVQDQNAIDAKASSDARKAAQERTGTGPSSSGSHAASGGSNAPNEDDPGWNWRTQGNGKRGVTLKDGSRQVVDGATFDKLKAEGKIDETKTPSLNGDTPSSGRARVRRHSTGTSGAGNLGDESLHKGRGMGRRPDGNVKAMQKVLDELGFDLGEAGVDGRFGPDTEKAVKKLQRRYGLKADGIVGRETKALIKRLAKRHLKAKNEGDQLTQITEADMTGDECDTLKDDRPEGDDGWHYDLSAHTIPDSRDGTADVAKRILHIGERLEEAEAAARAATGTQAVVLRARTETLRGQLEEALGIFNEKLHPRDRVGQWRDVLGRLDRAITQPKPKSANAIVRADHALLGLSTRVVKPAKRPNDLPEHHGSYFNLDDYRLKRDYGVGHSVVDLSKVKTTRADPEGTTNARPLMVSARKGQRPKRDPVTLVKQADGTYKVHDGNATVNIARGAGWKTIAAMVARDDRHAAEIEATMKARKAAMKKLKESTSEEALGSLDISDYTLVREGGFTLEEAADSLAKASSHKQGLEKTKGKRDNWIERAGPGGHSGQLPAYIQHIALAVRKQGKSTSQSIAIAVGTVKRWAAGGGNVDANTRAAAAKALREWEALKAKSKAKKIAEAKLSSATRDNLPDSAFAIPEKRAYPIHDESHARNALSRASGKPEEARVRAAVKKRYPKIGG